MTKPSSEVVQSALEILAEARVDIALSKYTSLSVRRPLSLDDLSPYLLYDLDNKKMRVVLSEGVIVSPSDSYVGVTVVQRESIFNVDIFPVRDGDNLGWQIKDGIGSSVKLIRKQPLSTLFDIQKDEYLHRFTLHQLFQTGPKFDYTFIPLEFYDGLRKVGN